MGTLGQQGIGIRGGWKEGGESSRQDSKVGDGFDLGDACGWRRTREGTGDNLKAMNDYVLCRWSQDGK